MHLEMASAIQRQGTIVFFFTLLVFVIVIPKTDGNLRVIGWQVYTHKSVYYRFGAQWSRNTAVFGGHYCWDAGSALCYVRLYFSDEEDSFHYQILGGKTNVFDSRTVRFCGSKEWGDTNRGTKRKFLHGYVWDECTKSWGYGYSYLYVEKSSDPPFLKALSEQAFKRDGTEKLQENIIAGSTRDAEKEMTGEFKVHRNPWGDDTLLRENFYMSESILIRYNPLYDQKKVKAPATTAVKTRVIVNDGCGHEYVDGMTGSITSREELTTVHKARWQKTFTFDIGASVEASGGIKIVSISASVSANFEWSVTKELNNEETHKRVWSYVWPRHCTPGFRCIYHIMKKVQEVEIPVVFTFKRGDETFEKRNVLKTAAETWHEEKRSEKLPERSCKWLEFLENLKLKFPSLG